VADTTTASMSPGQHPDMAFLASVTDESSIEHRAVRALAEAWDWDLDDLPLARRLVAALSDAGLLAQDPKPDEASS
jgi:hypothetical protein